MSNVNRVNGFRPVRYLNGAAWNGQANLYFIPNGDATALFVGDAVRAETTGDPTSSGGLARGVQSVIQGVASGAVLGVVVGFLVNPPNLDTPQFRAASTGRYCWVVDDPNVIFEAQEDGIGGALTVGSIGLNVDFIVGAGSTTVGTSGMQVDSSTAAAGATLPFKLLGFSQRQDNEVGNVLAKVLVKINNHQFGSSTGTAGV